MLNANRAATNIGAQYIMCSQPALAAPDVLLPDEVAGLGLATPGVDEAF